MRNKGSQNEWMSTTFNFPSLHLIFLQLISSNAVKQIPEIDSCPGNDVVYCKKGDNKRKSLI